jgi:ParB-like chromosome segregation protein Spo0J
MSAVAFASNVIPVDFRVAPVLMNYADASTPRSDIAKRLKAEAVEQVAEATAKALKDSRAPWLRLLGGRGEVPAVNPYNIVIADGWNSRQINDPRNIARIDELAQSIKKIGLQKPLTVRLEGPGKRTVVVKDGFCRLMAVYRAIEVYGCEIKSVEVHTVGRFTNEADDVCLQLLTGEPLSVLEQGNAFVKLVAHKWTAEQIAERVGTIKAARVTQILAFMEHANEAIKAMIVNGSIKATFAEQVLRDSGYDADVAEKVLTKALTVAVAAGKTKATAKHTGKVSAKKELATIFSTATVVADGKLRSVTVSDAQWDRVTKLLGIA